MPNEVKRDFNCMIPFSITNAECAIEFELKKLLTVRYN
jgi:hypothetical protein